MLPTFEKVPVLDTDLRRVQDRLSTILNALNGVPITDGVLLPAVSLTTSFQNVAHGLARLPRGWAVVGKDANADVWEAPAARSAVFLSLRGSAAVVAGIWVF